MKLLCLDTVGAVVIGRNEGERLKRCLQSVVGRVATVIYVDSGSADGSVDFARTLGVEVVNLDMSIPFTAARARNAGFTRLLELFPICEFVQFVDGDCELVDAWLPKAVETMLNHKDVVAVCGRRREQFPDASVYNKLCDMEWNTPVGETDACGGDTLFRVTPLKKLGGYNPALIAGEEPELCVRLRLNGWKILRIDAEMTLHDADMHYFSQWWKRALRSGHAYAEGNALHGRTRFRHYMRPLRSIFFWGLVVPLMILSCLVATWWTYWALVFAAFGALGFVVIIFRSFADRRRNGEGSRESWLYGSSCALAKFPQLVGAVRYYHNHWRGTQSSLIEYKKKPST